MKISFLKKLIEMVESSEIEELEIRKWWTSVRITKTRSAGASANPTTVVEKPVGRESQREETPAEVVPAEDNLVEIKSPMVGTFYRAPSPGAKAYVDAGERVQAGQVVCIIEAMKLMNEIESDVTGTVVRPLVEDAQPVEFGQPLFLVSPS